jgi:hypothetical protein
MHELLVRLLEAQDARLLAGGPQALAGLGAILGEVLGQGTKLIAGPVGLRAAALVKAMQASVPGAGRWPERGGPRETPAGARAAHSLAVARSVGPSLG